MGINTMKRKIIDYIFAVISIISIVGVVIVSRNSNSSGAFWFNIPIIFSVFDLWCVVIYFCEEKTYSTKKTIWNTIMLINTIYLMLLTLSSIINIGAISSFFNMIPEAIDVVSLIVLPSLSLFFRLLEVHKKKKSIWVIIGMSLLLIYLIVYLGFLSLAFLILKIFNLA